MNWSQNTVESSRTRGRLISFRWLALVFIVGIVELVSTQYEPACHWFRTTLALLGVLTSIVWVPLIIYCGFVSWRNPDRRGQQATRIFYFAAALFSLHALWMASQTISAVHAGSIVKAAEQFNAAQGHCPATLKEMGIEEEFNNGQSVGHKGVSFYDGAVFYPGPFPFSMNMYQCPGGPWTYETD